MVVVDADNRCVCLDLVVLPWHGICLNKCYNLTMEREMERILLTAVCIVGRDVQNG